MFRKFYVKVRGLLVTEVPLAKIQGESVVELPQDLYIPPDALEVFLEAFEGPLDLLLYLIKKQNLDILDIPIAEITKQYMHYVEMMQELRLELAAEYLVMAGTLAEIKSRMLLPRPETTAEDDDPRAELIRRLQEYERYKKAAEDIDVLPRVNRDVFLAQADYDLSASNKPQPQVDLKDLWYALSGVLERANMYESHHVEGETLSMREKMTHILNKLTPGEFADFTALFSVEEGRLGVIVTFSAILELLKQSIIEIVQTEVYGKIHVTKK